MAVQEGTERVINRVILSLQTYLPAALDAQDAAWAASDVTKWGAGNAIVLADVPNGWYYRTAFLEPNALPACYVIAAGDEAGQLLTGYKDKQHRVEVRTIVADTDPERAFSRICRTKRAIELVLEQYLADGTSCWNCEIEQTSAGVAQFDWENQPYVFGCTVTCSVWERVTRP